MIALGYLLTFGWVFLTLGLTLVLKKKTGADAEPGALLRVVWRGVFVGLGRGAEENGERIIRSEKIFVLPDDPAFL